MYVHTPNLPEIPQLTLFLLQARQQKVSRETGSRSSWYTGCRFFFPDIVRQALAPRSLALPGHSPAWLIE